MHYIYVVSDENTGRLDRVEVLFSSNASDIFKYVDQVAADYFDEQPIVKEVAKSEEIGHFELCAIGHRDGREETKKFSVDRTMIAYI